MASQSSKDMAKSLGPGYGTCSLLLDLLRRAHGHVAMRREQNVCS